MFCHIGNWSQCANTFNHVYVQSCLPSQPGPERLAIFCLPRPPLPATFVATGVGAAGGGAEAAGGEGITGIKGLASRELTYRLSFMACSVQARRPAPIFSSVRLSVTDGSCARSVIQGTCSLLRRFFLAYSVQVLSQTHACVQQVCLAPTWPHKAPVTPAPITAGSSNWSHVLHLVRSHSGTGVECRRQM